LLRNRSLPNELQHELNARSTRLWGGAKGDTVKIGSLTVGHIGRAVFYKNARGRRGRLRISRPAMNDATGYFAVLAAKATSYTTIRLTGLEINKPYAWSIDDADGAYHFTVSNLGQVVVDKKVRTVRKLDIGLAATVRSRGNEVDLKVWTDHQVAPEDRT